MFETRKSSGAVAGMPADEVRQLAQQAIRVLASQSENRPDVVERRLRMLCDSFLADRDDPRHESLLRLRQDGVHITDIVDHVIPEVARIMGRRWGADEISFADVTIGAARLQETVRALGAKDRSWTEAMHATEARNRHAVSGETREILLIIPRPEHHTLGAFVLSDQFRRLGYRCDIAIDLHPRQIAEKIRRRRYVMVGLTAAGRRTLASARELVDIIRTSVTRVTPIVIGGSVLDLELDARAMSGADHTARDARMALRKCGLAPIAELGQRVAVADHAG